MNTFPISHYTSAPLCALPQKPEPVCVPDDIMLGKNWVDYDSNYQGMLDHHQNSHVGFVEGMNPEEPYVFDAEEAMPSDQTLPLAANSGDNKLETGSFPFLSLALILGGMNIIRKVGWDLIRRPNFNRTVDILWFYENMHTKIGIDNQAYDGTMGQYTLYGVVAIGRDGRIDGENSFVSRARDGTGAPFIRYQIKLTEKEYGRIKNKVFKLQGKFRPQDCTLGACLPITGHSGVIIPFPFNTLPSFNGVYLSLMKFIGYQRIAKMDVEFQSLDGQKKLVAEMIKIESVSCFMAEGMFAFIGTLPLLALLLS